MEGMERIRHLERETNTCQKREQHLWKEIPNKDKRETKKGCYGRNRKNQTPGKRDKHMSKETRNQDKRETHSHHKRDIFIHVHV